jgi:hypothetical protein
MTLNMDGDTLTLERRPDDGKLFVSGVQIVAKDVVGTNGIIHVIDDIIMPDSGKYRKYSLNSVASCSKMLESLSSFGVKHISFQVMWARIYACTNINK